MQIKGESGAEKKAAKKAKKKQKKKKAEAVGSPDPSRASTPSGSSQTAPSETIQSNGGAQISVTAASPQIIDALQTAPTDQAAQTAGSPHAGQTAQTPLITRTAEGTRTAQIAQSAQSAAAVIELPPVLKGRDFITETGGSLDKIQQLGAGAEELTSAYVMGLCSAQPPGRIAEWCELAPAGVQEYLLGHPEEGTWWVFTLDLIQWPEARFSAMAEFLGRTENELLAKVLSSMAVAALRVRTTESRNRTGILRDGYLELPGSIDRRALDRAIDATAGLWAPGVSRKVAEGKLIEAWLRFATVAVQGTEALCAFFLKKAIDRGFSNDLGFVWATLSNKLSSIRSPPEVEMSVLNGLASGLRETEEALRKLLVWFPRPSSIEGHVATPDWMALLAQELQHAKALLPQLEFVIATQWRLTSYQTGLVS